MKIRKAANTGVDEALAILTAGGVIAHATETCYGLACDMSNPKAVAKLFRIKTRAGNQPVSALFSSISKAKEYVVWTVRAQELADKQLPGPLTLILRLQVAPPYKLYPCPDGGESLGVRISPHPIALALAKKFGRPLSTTSANVSGGPNPYSAQEIGRQFQDASEKPDLILDSGELPPNPPSKVIDLTKDDEAVLRG